MISYTVLVFVNMRFPNSSFMFMIVMIIVVIV